jgi:hypothetical protein
MRIKMAKIPAGSKPPVLISISKCLFKGGIILKVTKGSSPSKHREVRIAPVVKKISSCWAKPRLFKKDGFVTANSHSLKMNR